jgi:hypothetical protein
MIAGMETHASDLADLVLPEVQGDYIRLGELWGERPIAIVFLRHYG